MAKLLRTNGVGSAQTTAETQDSKEKVYTDLASAEADIANIAENEFVDTLDEEVVKEGDIATKDWAIGYPDYARGQLNNSNVTSYTATEDCYFNWFGIWYYNTSDSNYLKVLTTIVKVNNVQIAQMDSSAPSSSDTARVLIMGCSGYLKKGDVIASKRSNATTEGVTMDNRFFHVWGIKA
jgi:hypothetical protein